MSPDPKAKPKQEDIATDKTLTQLKDEKAGLVSSIDKFGVESARTIEDLGGRVEKDLANLRNEEQQIINFHSNLSHWAVYSINQARDKTVASIKKIEDSIHTYEVSLAALYGLVGILLGLITWNYLETGFVGFLIGWMIVGYLLYRRFTGIAAVIREQPDTLHDDLKKVATTLATQAIPLPQPKEDFSLVDKGVKMIQGLVSQIAITTSKLVPLTDRITDESVMELKRRHFVQGFSYAMQRYGFDAFDTKVQTTLQKRSWLVENEVEWLKGLISDMKRFYPSYDEAVFQLAYYDSRYDRGDVDHVWPSIASNPAILKQVATQLLASKLVTPPNVTNESIATVSDLLSKIKLYSLDVVRVEAEEFFDRLAGFKEDCITYLSFYGLTIKERKDQLMAYVPPSVSHDAWRDEVMAYIASSILGLDPLVVKLLIAESMDDASRKSAWRSVLESGKVDKVADILVTKRLKNPNTGFSGDVYLKHVQLAMANSPDDFVVSSIESNLRFLESEIIRVAEEIHHTATEFRLSIEGTDFAYSFTPSKIDEIESQLTDIASRIASVHQKVFQLLYLTASGSERQAESFEGLGKNGELNLLAQFLVEHDFITRDSFNQYTIEILSARRTFNLLDFTETYELYRRLYEDLTLLREIMDQHGIMKEGAIITFGDLLSLCPPAIPRSYDEQVVELAKNMTADNVDGRSLTSTQVEGSAMVAAVLFLKDRDEMAARRLSQSISLHGFARDVLYRYIRLADEAVLASDFPKIRKAVLQVLSGPVEDVHFEYFKSQLQDGKLFLRASYLMSWQMAEVKSEVEKLRSEGFESAMLENYVEPIRDVLSSAINEEEVVKDLLTTQVISAYLLTVPDNYPVITFVTEGLPYLTQASSELANKRSDPQYTDLIRLSVGGGKSTRIGLVPYGMSFDEFASKFEDVYSRAIDICRLNPGAQRLVQGHLTCNLMRIFPSDDALKEVMATGEKEEKPLEMIRNLMNGMRSSDSVPLLTLLTPGAKSVGAFRVVFKRILDHPKSSLYTIAKDRIDLLLSKAPQLREDFLTRRIDKTMFSAYGVKSPSELCIKVADEVMGTSLEVTHATFKSRLQTHLANAGQLSAEEAETLVWLFFGRVRNCGVILTV